VSEREKQRLRESMMSSLSRDIAKRLHIPLSSLIHALHTLGGNLFTDENRALWHDAMRDGQSLNQSVNMMLMFANEQPLKTSKCNMESLVHDTLQAMDRFNALPEDISVTADIAENLPACEVDGDQIKMVLWNLVQNAATAQQTIKNPEIRIQVSSRPFKGKPVVVVDVMDSGPNFDPAEVGAYFEPFAGKWAGGVGLGLPLSKRAVERHGGRIGMERKSGVTRVSFAVPVERERGASAAPPAKGGIVNKRVLN
jgi:signal transduction histidine kinase